MSTLTAGHVWTAVTLGGSDSRKRTGVDNNERFQRHKTAYDLVRGVGRKEGAGSLHEQGLGSDG
ncbi:MAG: hypothetical protein CMA46_01485 [Euryarchaeota archaeon]|nr:hypothetical protein [Euryarchaeota archaeon]